MWRIAGRLCVALLAFLSVVAGTASPVHASAATVTCSSYHWSYLRVFSQPPVISPAITCTVSNGVAPYSYSWQKTGGDSNIKASAPSSNTTGFKRGVANGGYWVSTFRLDVVDATGSVVSSAPVTVEFEWENGL